MFFHKKNRFIAKNKANSISDLTLSIPSKNLKLLNVFSNN